MPDCSRVILIYGQKVAIDDGDDAFIISAWPLHDDAICHGIKLFIGANGNYQPYLMRMSERRLLRLP